MPVLLILLAVAVFAYAWAARRNSTLTRACRWRLDRNLGPSVQRCAACGAVCDPGLGKAARHCLREP